MAAEQERPSQLHGGHAVNNGPSEGGGLEGGGARGRILAIDDEPHMLVLLERIVREKTPHSIVTTNNPLEVPGLLESQSFDVIITDLKMPRLGGLDILRLVRACTPPPRVVLITAFGTHRTERQARDLGVFAYITKPFRKEDLLDCLDRALKRDE